MFKRRFAIPIFAAVLSVVSVPHIVRSQQVLDDSVFTPSLGETRRFAVLLPRGYNPAQRWPVLVLLHGYTGNSGNWLALTHVAEYASNLPLLIVFPDGGNSWYVDQLRKPGKNFETYLINDLLRKVREEYSVDTSRIAIGGLSMGGYGALVLGLRHPALFSFVGALSASLDVPEGIPDLTPRGRQGLFPSLDTALGDHPSAQWDSHNLFRLVENLDSARVPYFYLANGIQDEFEVRLYLHREFADALRRHHFPYEYHETPGRHNWEYWDREIRGVLTRLSERWGLK